MPAYIVVDIHISDPELYQEYIRIAPATIALYNGRYLARGGAAEQLEGDRRPKRIVVLEFPSAQRAKEWWSSPEYAPARAIRERSATAEMLLVEGLN